MERLKAIALHPGASALFFHRFVEVMVRYIIGWDKHRHRPYIHFSNEVDENDEKINHVGGLFGIPEAWSFVVQGQCKQTLHAHVLIWILKHSGMLERFKKISCSCPRRAIAT